VYARTGAAGLLLAFEPLAGWREVAVTATRTRADGARLTRALLGGRYKAADRVVLVVDQLNTHSVASLYEASAPAGGRRLAGRPEVHHPPKRGSRLNMAEVELSAPARDLPDRVGDRAAMARHIGARKGRRDTAGAKADRQFTTADARARLRKLYPTIDE
jgi:hypothetical protein